MASSINGTGDHWDPHVVEHRPEIAIESTMYADEILLRIQEDMRGFVECAYDGEDHTHPLAQETIRRYCLVRAGEAADQLEGLEVAPDGTIAVDRVICAEPEGLRASLGAFWTTDVWHGGIMSAPWGHVEGATLILVSARVHHSDVDWQTSCLARMDWYSGDAEKELRLLPGRRLRDVSAREWTGSLVRDEHVPVVLPDLDWTT